MSLALSCATEKCQQGHIDTIYKTASCPCPISRQLLPTYLLNVPTTASQRPTPPASAIATKASKRPDACLGTSPLEKKRTANSANSGHAAIHSRASLSCWLQTLTNNAAPVILPPCVTLAPLTHPTSNSSGGATPEDSSSRHKHLGSSHVVLGDGQANRPKHLQHPVRPAFCSVRPRGVFFVDSRYVPTRLPFHHHRHRCLGGFKVRFRTVLENRYSIRLLQWKEKKKKSQQSWKGRCISHYMLRWRDMGERA